MSGIIAIFNRTGLPVDHGLPETMLDACPGRGLDGCEVRSDGPVALGHQLLLLLPEERRGEQPIVQDGLLFAGDCRLDNRSDLIRQLSLDDGREAEMSDAMLLMLAYQAWGESCPQRLLGDFAFVVWDSLQQRLFAARDSMGGRGVYYFINDSVCLIASEISQILAHPAVQARINEERVASFLMGLNVAPGETYYRDIHDLPPAHAISVSADSVKMWRHWDAEPEIIRYRDEREYAERYRELLTEAVRFRLRSVGPVGISMSGGLDSTSLAALITPMLPAATGQQRLKSFSYAFDELKSCDEREYILPVVERYDLDATYIPSDDRWTLKDLPDWPVTRDFVMADSYYWLPASVRQAAGEAGIKLLIGGYYGEYLMTGQNYWALDMMRGWRIGLLGRTIWTRHRTLRWREAFVEFGLRRLIPPSAALAYRRVRPRQASVVAPGIHEDLVARTGSHDRLLPSVPPLSRSAPGIENRYRTMTGSGFGKGDALRHQYNQLGVELVNPYIDRRLMEFVLSIPAYVIGRPGEDRRLHREAMTGLLPEEVRQRRQRTVFSPLLYKGLREKEVDTVKRIMAKPQVVERRYIQGDWLKSQLQREFDMSPGSLLLWRCISLELWLQRYWT